MSLLQKTALAGALALTLLGVGVGGAAAQPFGDDGPGPGFRHHGFDRGPGGWHHGPRGPWGWHRRPHGPWGWHHHRHWHGY
ncbi:hypothetical protein P7D22_21815 [Lichenihabitans sp. Uapishka_5]|uniref:hypothetical protein n=1 Tax=Lichenihabitans sp. Uapishka_5 TaxID=3037302 RepID=UPI0029E7DF16|nr:hypothetical protein [Lichenihabitans sp. Uapishka_5]MDX7953805.1 hypothetical protein [Lichenihabitans sp. Uapishka_5]